MIRPAPLAELRARGAPLFAAAAAETGSPGDVQWPHLEVLDSVGVLLLLVVEVDGELVGYSCATVGPELTSAGVSCQTMSLFVQPRHRGRWGSELLRAVAAAAEARGATLFRVQVVPGSRLERLVRLLGFEPTSIAFERRSMQYTAGHACRARNHCGAGARVQRVRGRAAGGRREEGDAAAGAGAERG